MSVCHAHKWLSLSASLHKIVVIALSFPQPSLSVSSLTAPLDVTLTLCDHGTLVKVLGFEQVLQGWFDGEGTDGQVPIITTEVASYLAHHYVLYYCVHVRCRGFIFRCCAVCCCYCRLVAWSICCNSISSSTGWLYMRISTSSTSCATCATASSCWLRHYCVLQAAIGCGLAGECAALIEFGS